MSDGLRQITNDHNNNNKYTVDNLKKKATTYIESEKKSILINDDTHQIDLQPNFDDGLIMTRMLNQLANYLNVGISLYSVGCLSKN